jgi:hypothetical protein
MGMAKKDAEQGEMRISSPDDNRMGAFARFLITTLVIVVIMMTLGVVAVRLDGGREFIADWLGNKLGMEVEIGSCRIGLPYALVMNDVVSKTFKNDEDPGFSAREVVIGPGLKTFWKVKVNACRLNLTQETDDSWQPAFFARMGDLPIGNITDVSRLTERFRKSVQVEVKDGTVRWYSNLIGARPSVRGLSFEVKPARIDSEKMYYHALSVYHVVGINGEKESDIERCWLTSRESSYIELDRAGEDLSAGIASFWEQHEVGSRTERKKIAPEKIIQSEKREEL